KILQDDNTVESYKIEEKGYIVCMVQKPKQPSGTTTPAKTPAASSTATASTPSQPPAAQRPAPSAPSTTDPTTPSPAARTMPAPTSAPSTASAVNDPSALLMGKASQVAVSEMEAMGFPRDEAVRAMRAAFFNPDRAIEYLLNGIPEAAEQAANAQQQTAQTQGTARPGPVQGGEAGTQEQQAEAAAAVGGESGDEPINLFDAAARARPSSSGDGAAPAAGTGAGLAAATGGGAGVGGASTGGLDFLRNNPHFNQLRHLVQQNPQMLEPILQQLSQGNPGLAALIGQHQDEFLQLLSEDDGDEGDDAVAQLLGGAGGEVPGQQTISVTEEERDAIERLCNLGFSREMVIQAYFACDKNEELAANFLFDQPDDGEQ
ncbi:hypothetical protein KEM55_004529, partial [Ascosphaera atra]